MNPFFLPSILDAEDKTSPLKNCIRNNYRHIRKWAQRSITDCFRIYDRHIKEYPLTIDFYAGHFYVQYFFYDRDEDSFPLHKEEEIRQVLKNLLGTKDDLIHFRARIKRSKLEQYEKLGSKKQFLTVREYGALFYVNLFDYLDTGLFLDHRETRRIVASCCQGKKVLNLFAYTCSFSVHAALKGASYTKSVDLSNTYTEWGKENFILNGLSLENNVILREDCLKFLENEVLSKERYDIIVLDPPTLSRSKKMEQFFEVQTDYVFLLSKALSLLLPGGILFFSTNFRKFHFNEALFPSYIIQEITSQTIPLDFHNQKIHKCWKIKLK